MNNHKIRVFICLLAFFSLKANAENEIITLKECYKQLYSNHPIALNKNLIFDKEKILTEIVQKGWKPGISIKAQITDQSDAVQMTQRDKYSIQAEVEQLLYDAGKIKTKKLLETENTSNEILKNEIDLYSLRDKVNQYFFEIALNKNQQEILKVSYDDLNSRLKYIESGIKNGIRLKTDALILNSEIISIEKEINEKSTNRIALIKMLSELLGTDYNDSYIFQIPEISGSYAISDDFKNRYEIKLFDSERKKIDLIDTFNNLKTKPVVSVFGQTGYANPALNMFQDKFEAYLITGFRLSWRPIDWNVNRDEIKANALRKKIIENQQKIFLKNMRINEIKIKSEIANLSNQISMDKELIKIKNEILESVTSQFNNGVLNSTDFITHTNSLLSAKRTLSLHLIQSAYFDIMLKTLKGEEL